MIKYFFKYIFIFLLKILVFYFYVDEPTTSLLPNETETLSGQFTLSVFTEKDIENFTASQAPSVATDLTKEEVSVIMSTSSSDETGTPPQQVTIDVFTKEEDLDEVSVSQTPSAAIHTTKEEISKTSVIADETSPGERISTKTGQPSTIKSTDVKSEVTSTTSDEEFTSTIKLVDDSLKYTSKIRVTPSTEDTEIETARSTSEKQSFVTAETTTGKITTSAEISLKHETVTKATETDGITTKSATEEKETDRSATTKTDLEIDTTISLEPEMKHTSLTTDFVKETTAGDAKNVSDVIALKAEIMTTSSPTQEKEKFSIESRKKATTITSFKVMTTAEVTDEIGISTWEDKTASQTTTTDEEEIPITTLATKVKDAEAAAETTLKEEERVSLVAKSTAPAALTTVAEVDTSIVSKDSEIELTTTQKTAATDAVERETGTKDDEFGTSTLESETVTTERTKVEKETEVTHTTPKDNKTLEITSESAQFGFTTVPSVTDREEIKVKEHTSETDSFISGKTGTTIKQTASPGSTTDILMKLAPELGTEPTEVGTTSGPRTSKAESIVETTVSPFHDTSSTAERSAFESTTASMKETTTVDETTHIKEAMDVGSTLKTMVPPTDKDTVTSESDIFATKKTTETTTKSETIAEKGPQVTTFDYPSFETEKITSKDEIVTTTEATITDGDKIAIKDTNISIATSKDLPTMTTIEADTDEFEGETKIFYSSSEESTGETVGEPSQFESSPSEKTSVSGLEPGTKSTLAFTAKDILDEQTLFAATKDSKTTEFSAKETTLKSATQTTPLIAEFTKVTSTAVKTETEVASSNATSYSSDETRMAEKSTTLQSVTSETATQTQTSKIPLGVTSDRTESIDYRTSSETEKTDKIPADVKWSSPVLLSVTSTASPSDFASLTDGTFKPIEIKTDIPGEEAGEKAVKTTEVSKEVTFLDLDQATTTTESKLTSSEERDQSLFTISSTEKVSDEFSTEEELTSIKPIEDISPSDIRSTEKEGHTATVPPQELMLKFITTQTATTIMDSEADDLATKEPSDKLTDHPFSSTVKETVTTKLTTMHIIERKPSEDKTEEVEKTSLFTTDSTLSDVKIVTDNATGSTSDQEDDEKTDITQSIQTGATQKPVVRSDVTTETSSPVDKVTETVPLVEKSKTTTEIDKTETTSIRSVADNITEPVVETTVKDESIATESSEFTVPKEVLDTSTADNQTTKEEISILSISSEIEATEGVITHSDASTRITSSTTPMPTENISWKTKTDGDKKITPLIDLDVATEDTSKDIQTTEGFAPETTSTLEAEKMETSIDSLATEKPVNFTDEIVPLEIEIEKISKTSTAETADKPFSTTTAKDIASTSDEVSTVQKSATEMAEAEETEIIPKSKKEQITPISLIPSSAEVTLPVDTETLSPGAPDKLRTTLDLTSITELSSVEPPTTAVDETQPEKTSSTFAPITEKSESISKISTTESQKLASEKSTISSITDTSTTVSEEQFTDQLKSTTISLKDIDGDKQTDYTFTTLETEIVTDHMIIPMTHVPDSLISENATIPEAKTETITPLIDVEEISTNATEEARVVTETTERTVLPSSPSMKVASDLEHSSFTKDHGASTITVYKTDLQGSEIISTSEIPKTSDYEDMASERPLSPQRVTQKTSTAEIIDSVTEKFESTEVHITDTTPSVVTLKSSSPGTETTLYDTHEAETVITTSGEIKPTSEIPETDMALKETLSTGSTVSQTGTTIDKQLIDVSSELPVAETRTQVSIETGITTESSITQESVSRLTETVKADTVTEEQIDTTSLSDAETSSVHVTPILFGLLSTEKSATTTEGDPSLKTTDFSSKVDSELTSETKSIPQTTGFEFDETSTGLTLETHSTDMTDHEGKKLTESTTETPKTEVKVQDTTTISVISQKDKATSVTQLPQEEISFQTQKASEIVTLGLTDGERKIDEESKTEIPTGLTKEFFAAVTSTEVTDSSRNITELISSTEKEVTTTSSSPSNETLSMFTGTEGISELIASSTLTSEKDIKSDTPSDLVSISTVKAFTDEFEAEEQTTKEPSLSTTMTSFSDTTKAADISLLAETTHFKEEGVTVTEVTSKTTIAVSEKEAKTTESVTKATTDHIREGSTTDTPHVEASTSGFTSIADELETTKLESKLLPTGISDATHIDDVTEAPGISKIKSETIKYSLGTTTSAVQTNVSEEIKEITLTPIISKVADIDETSSVTDIPITIDEETSTSVTDAKPETSTVSIKNITTKLFPPEEVSILESEATTLEFITSDGMQTLITTTRSDLDRATSLTEKTSEQPEQILNLTTHSFVTWEPEASETIVASDVTETVQDGAAKKEIVLKSESIDEIIKEIKDTTQRIDSVTATSIKLEIPPITTTPESSSFSFTPDDDEEFVTKTAKTETVLFAEEVGTPKTMLKETTLFDVEGTSTIVTTLKEITEEEETTDKTKVSVTQFTKSPESTTSFLTTETSTSVFTTLDTSVQDSSKLTKTDEPFKPSDTTISESKDTSALTTKTIVFTDGIEDTALTLEADVTPSKSVKHETLSGAEGNETDALTVITEEIVPSVFASTKPAFGPQTTESVQSISDSKTLAIDVTSESLDLDDVTKSTITPFTSVKADSNDTLILYRTKTTVGEEISNGTASISLKTDETTDSSETKSDFTSEKVPLFSTVTNISEIYETTETITESVETVSFTKEQKPAITLVPEVMSVTSAKTEHQITESDKISTTETEEKKETQDAEVTSLGTTPKHFVPVETTEKSDVATLKHDFATETDVKVENETGLVELEKTTLSTTEKWIEHKTEAEVSKTTPYMTTTAEPASTSERQEIADGEIFKTSTEIADIQPTEKVGEPTSEKTSAEAEAVTKFTKFEATDQETALKGKTTDIFDISSDKTPTTSVTTALSEKDTATQTKISTIETETEHSLITEKTILSNVTLAAGDLIKFNTTPTDFPASPVEVDSSTSTSSDVSDSSTIITEISTTKYPSISTDIDITAAPVTLKSETTASDIQNKSTLEAFTSELVTKIKLGTEKPTVEFSDTFDFSRISTFPTLEAEISTSPEVPITESKTSPTPTSAVEYKDLVTTASETIGTDSSTPEERFETKASENKTDVTVSEILTTFIGTDTESAFITTKIHEGEPIVTHETTTESLEGETSTFPETKYTTIISPKGETSTADLAALDQSTSQKSTLFTGETKAATEKIDVSISTTKASESSTVGDIRILDEISTTIKSTEIHDAHSDYEVPGEHFSRPAMKIGDFTTEKRTESTEEPMGITFTSSEIAKPPEKLQTDHISGAVSTTSEPISISLTTKDELLTDTEATELQPIKTDVSSDRPIDAETQKSSESISDSTIKSYTTEGIQLKSETRTFMPETTEKAPVSEGMPSESTGFTDAAVSSLSLIPRLGAGTTTEKVYTMKSSDDTEIPPKEIATRPDAKLTTEGEIISSTIVPAEFDTKVKDTRFPMLSPTKTDMAETVSETTTKLISEARESSSSTMTTKPFELFTDEQTSKTIASKLPDFAFTTEDILDVEASSTPLGPEETEPEKGKFLSELYLNENLP